MADTLAIHDLILSCRLGVFEWEREQPQEIRVDVELDIDAVAAAEEDDVRQTVDYAALVAAITTLAQGRAFRLMETLAHAIAMMVLERGRATAVSVRVKKQALAGIGYAAVTVERRRRLARRVGRARASSIGRRPAAREVGRR
jgi:dihydroneopterin aldolase